VFLPFYLLGLLVVIPFSLFKKKQTSEKDKRAVLVESISEMLQMQKTVSGEISIMDSSGRLNRKAMGYIYGFTDAALQSIGQDIRDVSIGMPTIFGVFCSLYPGKELEYTDYLLDNVGNDEVVMIGVVAGGQQYSDLISGCKTSPMQFGLYLLEGDNFTSTDATATPKSPSKHHDNNVSTSKSAKDSSVIILP
jgi:hypothetical protein